MEKISGGDLGKYFGDLITSWWVILAMAGITVVLSCIYLALLRCATKPVLYISFVLIFLMLLGGGFYVYYLSTRYDDNDHTKSVM